MAQHNWTILNFSFFLTLFSAHDLQMINIDNRMDNWKWYHFVQNWTFPLFTNMYPENPPRPLESLLLNREMGAFIFCRVLIIRIRIIFSFQSFPSQLFLFSLWLKHFPDLISRIPGCWRCSARWFCYLWQSVRHIAISRALLFLYQDNQSCATRPRSHIHTLPHLHPLWCFVVFLNFL